MASKGQGIPSLAQPHDPYETTPGRRYYRWKAMSRGITGTWRRVVRAKQRAFPPNGYGMRLSNLMVALREEIWIGDALPCDGIVVGITLRLTLSLPLVIAVSH